VKPAWRTFSSVYWESRASTFFGYYLLVLRRRCINGPWYCVCVCQLTVVRLQCNRSTANWHYTYAIYKGTFMKHLPTEDEQVMSEKCRGSWFSINWMKSASRWSHYTDILYYDARSAKHWGVRSLWVRFPLHPRNAYIIKNHIKGATLKSWVIACIHYIIFRPSTVHTSDLQSLEYSK
jgi:hypothetical protein